VAVFPTAVCPSFLHHTPFYPVRNYLPIFAFIFFAFSLAATPAPNFTVTTSDGVPRNLYGDYINQQKIVVIEAFFTTCPPCNTHAPDWQALYQSMQATYPGKVEFLMLSTQNFDKNTNVAAYKTTKGLTMPGAGQDGGSMTALSPYTSGQFGDFLGTPTFIVIAPGTGEVTFDVRGSSAANTMSLLSQKIAMLLAPPPAPPCTLRDFFGNLLPNVQMKIDAPAFDTSFFTSSNYELAKVKSLKNTNYTIIPVKNDSHLIGVTTLDIAFISRHILNLEPLKCPWQLLAADANCSGTITMLDVIALRRVILGILDTLPCGSWKFSPPNATAGNGVCANFQAAKTGNLNAGPNCPQAANRKAEDRSVPAPLQLSPALTCQQVTGGQTFRMIVYSASIGTMTGLQAAWQYDPQLFEVQAVESAILPDFSAEYFYINPEKGTIRLAWSHPEGVDFNGVQPLLTFVLKARTLGAVENPVRFAPDILVAEAADLSGKAHPVEWSNMQSIAPVAGVSIFPNPAKETFEVGFESENATVKLLQLFDLQGKMVATPLYNAEKGWNKVSLAVPTVLSGLYFLRMDGKSAGKVILIK